MNKRQWLSVWGFALGAAAVPYASAQTKVEPPSEPMVQTTPGGIDDYISGGAGEEDRTTMAARQAEFPFKVVMSVPNGEYLVADRLSVLTPQGSLVIVRDAGPIVMMKLPPGPYILEASYHGKTERRSVQVAASSQTVNWRLAG
jgi:hypothetical protein